MQEKAREGEEERFRHGCGVNTSALLLLRRRKLQTMHRMIGPSLCGAVMIHDMHINSRFTCLIDKE